MVTCTGLDLFNGLYMDSEFNMEAGVVLESVCPELEESSILSSSLYPSTSNTVLLRGQSSNRVDHHSKIWLPSTAKLLSSVDLTSATAL